MHGAFFWEKMNAMGSPIVVDNGDGPSGVIKQPKACWKIPSGNDSHSELENHHF
jgi:hypothetical protein